MRQPAAQHAAFYPALLCCEVPALLLEQNAKLRVQPGTIPAGAGGRVTADFLVIALEVSLQKGCFGCLSLILFFLCVCMFPGRRFGVIFSFWSCLVFLFFFSFFFKYLGKENVGCVKKGPRKGRHITTLHHWASTCLRL